MSTLKNQKTFINELTTIFPEIKSEVLDEDYEGLITLQIGCFKRFTQKVIDNNDLNTVKKCLDFVDANLDLVELSVENALVISYLGKLNITKDGKLKNLFL